MAKKFPPPDEESWEHQDPSTITGKHNIVRMQRGLEPLDHAPWWARLVYGALDRWGVPTLMLAITVAGFAYYFNTERQDRKEERAAMVTAIEQNTQAIRQLSEALKVRR